MQNTTNTNEQYQYGERQIEAMPKKEMTLYNGQLAGYISSFLGVFSFLAVLCFLFPTYLTTQTLREVYNPDFLKIMLQVGMWASILFAVICIVIERRRKLAIVGVLYTSWAHLLGGYSINYEQATDDVFSFGFDWLILAFIISAIICITLEKTFPKYKEQVVLRPKWKLDMVYFSVNHLLITGFMLVGNWGCHQFSWAINEDFQAQIRTIPVILQFLIIFMCADFILYWSHRVFHIYPKLWKFHAVHHSTEHMDWLAGSRSHMVHSVFERSLIMLLLFLLGADKTVVDTYIIFAATQAVLIHLNSDLPVGWLRFILVTPQFHHWHHASDQPAIDTNFAAHTVLFDRLFGTYHMPIKYWPKKYGTTKPLPQTYIGQFLYPFKD
ncbi:sterol desaturase family protein [Marinicellulosiphila megalodicopiae]|uniref:sterol desaturase family protein n=1 Tax=Marinicellulosiphila megalodicopiae TaxID=2724896 RepID=UPI003BAEC32F